MQSLLNGRVGMRTSTASRRCSAALRRPVDRSYAVRTAALYHNPGPRDSGKAKAAGAAVETILKLVAAGDREALCDYFATSNLTDAPTLKLASGCEVVVFEDVMESMMLREPSRHFLDSYAIRHLILNAPASKQTLSGLMLGPNKYVQRMSVTAPSGEGCILTFTMTAAAAQPELGTAAGAVAAASVPADQAATTPAPPLEPVWRLSSVRGEPQFGVGGTQPVGPSPELSPEQIVEAQLAALQRKDVPAAFQFLSPGSQKIIGDERQFAENMSRHRRYGGLLGHIAATSVRRCMARPSTYMEIVSVTSASGIRFVFCYILGHENGMWSIDFVKVIDDPRLVAAVDSSCAAQRKARPADEQ
ncbi:hypothetical protein CHLRE_03g207600v5 [Chlamydomonas reinhardtii]|uniref:Uncharacterized protein n=1 Tax=Chlamydomonas reinhardtii TaxID=3055 RepID=A0A2K3DYW4_CHLRE|nr:uncharacterized protein CHLRE_03g207600v5 [Chlamydomonas reinhardtii]PNW85734.1 hypothetical protein CHLRE_03g207600v5 [Chlamydomonas reinhardtii]